MDKVARSAEYVSEVASRGAETLQNVSTTLSGNSASGQAQSQSQDQQQQGQDRGNLENRSAELVPDDGNQDQSQQSA
ncbi:hypothetical protein BGX26_006548 [Mortierella sp. AD094]|nr:hypothetical protein BGX26_006548 [Mortierella sp. AD094]